MKYDAASKSTSFENFVTFESWDDDQQSVPASKADSDSDNHWYPFKKIADAETNPPKPAEESDKQSLRFYSLDAALMIGDTTNGKPAEEEKEPARETPRTGTWFDDYRKMGVPPGSDKSMTNFDVLRPVPLAQRDMNWCNQAVDCFEMSQTAQGRQAVLQELFNSTSSVNKDLKEHYLRSFLQLSKVDAARRMEEAARLGDQQAVKAAASDFALYNNLVEQKGVGGDVLLRAIQNLPKNPDGSMAIRADRSAFVRGVMNGNGISFEQSENLPENTPKAVKDIFEKNPGMWDGAQGNVSKMWEKSDREYQKLVSDILNPNNSLTMEQSDEQLKKLDELNTNSFQRYKGTLADLKVLAAFKTLQESNDPERVRRAVATINENNTPLSNKCQDALIKSGLNGNVGMEQLKAFRQNQPDLTDLLKGERNRIQVDFFEEPVQKFIAENPMKRPPLELLEPLQEQLKAEADRGNKKAQERLEWVDAEILCGRIEMQPSRQAATQLSEELVKSIVRKDGSVNQSALNASISLLGSSATPEQWGQWADLRREKFFYTDLKFPSQVAFRKDLALGLEKVFSKLGDNLELTPSQVLVLSMGLERPDAKESPTESAARATYTESVEKCLRQTLRSNAGGPSEKQARAKVVVEAMLNNSSGLGSVLLEVEPEVLKKLMPSLDKLNDKCTPDALILLASIASGTAGGDVAMARDAATLLCTVASKDERNLKPAIEIVSQTLKDRGDQGMLLETLGNLSFMLPDKDFEVGELLLQGYRNSSNPDVSKLGARGKDDPRDFSRTPIVTKELTETEKVEHRISAAFAMLADTRNLNQNSVNCMCSRMTPEMAVVLNHLAGTLSEQESDLFIKELRKELQVPPNWNADNVAQMETALLAFQPFARNARTEDVTLLRNILDVKIDKNDPLAKEKQSMQQIALDSLFCMLDSTDEKVRGAVFDTLERKDWPAHLFPGVRAGLGTVVEFGRNLSDQELNRAFSMVPGNDAVPPFRLTLARMGVKDAREVSLDIMKQVQAKGGAKELNEKVLPALVAANAFSQMPQDMQQQLLLDAGFPMNSRVDINELARALASGKEPEIMPFLLGLNKQMERLAEKNVKDVKDFAKKAELEKKIVVEGLLPVKLDPLGAVTGAGIIRVEELRWPNEKLEKLPADISNLPYGPRAHVLVLAELQEQQKLDAEARKQGLGKSVLWRTGAELFGAQTDYSPRIKALKDWCEKYNIAGVNHRVVEERLAKLNEQTTESVRQLGEVQTAQLISVYNQLRATGQNANADQLLISMWSQNRLPASLDKDFSGLWKKMNEFGVAPSAQIPEFKGTREEQMEQAFAVLASLKERQHLDPEINKLETAMREAVNMRCQQIIMEQPAVTGMLDKIDKFCQSATNLDLYFQILSATEDGKRDPTMVEFIRSSARSMQSILNDRTATEDVFKLAKRLEEEKAKLPADSSARKLYEEMILELYRLPNPIDPKSKVNKELKPIVDDCVDGKKIRNHEWYEKATADLIHTVVVGAFCAAAQAGCELIPFVGHGVSLVVVPIVATVVSNVVDECLFQADLQGHGSVVGDLAFGRVPNNAKNREAAANQLCEQFQAEFEMNAACAGFGWIGSRFGRLVGTRLGTRALAPAVERSIPARFLNAMKANVGTGITLSSVDTVGKNLNLNVPVALVGFAIAGAHGFHAGMRAPVSTRRAQRVLKDGTEPQTSKRLVPETTVKQSEANESKAKSSEANEPKVFKSKGDSEPNEAKPNAKQPDGDQLARVTRLLDGKTEANLKNYKLVEVVADYRGNSGHSKYIVTLEGPKGDRIRAIFHTGDTPISQERFRFEQAAYKLNRALGFDNGFPPTVEREFTINGETKKGWLQVDAGEQLETASRLLAERTGRTNKYPDVVRMLKSADEPNADPAVVRFRDQLEQAFVERLIYGDFDSHSMNFVVQNNFTRGLRIRNIDLEYGFGSRTVPEWAAGPNAGVNESLQGYFSEARISNETLRRVTEFVKEYDTPEGRKKLAEFGLKTKAPNSDNWLVRMAERFGFGKKQLQIDEVDALLKRAKWFIDPKGGDGRFPKLQSTRDPKLKPADLAEFFKKGELPPGEYFVKDQNGGRVKVFAGVETVKFEEDGFVDLPKGKPVTVGAFETVMDTAFEQKNRPGRIRLLNDPKGADYGQFFSFPNTSEVMVNEYRNDQLKFSYDHETGHLIEHLELLWKSDLNFKKDFNDAYERCLFKPGNILERPACKKLNAKDASDLKTNDTDSYETRLLKWQARSEVETMLDPDKWYRGHGEEYFHCRSELIAEMHAYFREQTRAAGRGEPRLTYQQLVERVSGKDARRAEAMRYYEEVYNMLEPRFAKMANEMQARGAVTPKSEPPLATRVKSSARDNNQVTDRMQEGNGPAYKRITENDQVPASEDATTLNLQKALTKRLVKQGWPKGLSEQMARQLDPKALREALICFDENAPCAVFIGQKDKGSVEGRDEVTNAATVLYFTPEDGVVHILDEVPRDALNARFGQGDTVLFEQSWGLDQRNLPKKPTKYEVPRKEYEEILRKVGKGHIIEVTDPDTGVRFLTVIPGHEAVVGKLVVDEVKQKRGNYSVVREVKSYK